MPHAWLQPPILNVGHTFPDVKQASMERSDSLSAASVKSIAPVGEIFDTWILIPSVHFP